MLRQTAALLPVSFREQAQGDGLGTVEGVVVVYGDQARIGARIREKFAPGSIQLYERGVGANMQHDRGKPLARYPDGGLQLIRTRRALRAAIELPDTTCGRDAAELVRRGVLTGLSLEFRARDQDIDESGDTYTVKAAIATGVALVDIPAYPQSDIERLRSWLDAEAEPQPQGQGRRRRWR